LFIEKIVTISRITSVTDFINDNYLQFSKFLTNNRSDFSRSIRKPHELCGRNRNLSGNFGGRNIIGQLFDESLASCRFSGPIATLKTNEGTPFTNRRHFYNCKKVCLKGRMIIFHQLWLINECVWIQIKGPKLMFGVPASIKLKLWARNLLKTGLPLDLFQSFVMTDQKFRSYGRYFTSKMAICKVLKIRKKYLLYCTCSWTQTWPNLTLPNLVHPIVLTLPGPSTGPLSNGVTRNLVWGVQFSIFAYKIC